MSEYQTGVHVPSSFYEIIAYFGSGALCIALFCIGFTERTALSAFADWLSVQSAPQTIALLVVLALVAYTYSQLVSALSAQLIGTPVKFVVGKLKSSSEDFKEDFTSLVQSHRLAGFLPQKKLNNKWTLYFFLLAVVPEIGRDLLKRYAREKLARINATNMLFLLALAIAAKILNLTGWSVYFPLRHVIQIPTTGFTSICAALLMGFVYEYYKRKCWNNDLLTKVFPVGVYVAKQAQDD